MFDCFERIAEERRLHYQQHPKRKQP
jgi:hypothetical protein